MFLDDYKIFLFRVGVSGSDYDKVLQANVGLSAQRFDGALILGLRTGRAQVLKEECFSHMLSSTLTEEDILGGIMVCFVRRLLVSA